MDYSEQLLADLTNALGTSGHEDSATEVMLSYIEGFAEVQFDKLGSLIGKKKGSADQPRVLIDSHLDEIGFMVKEITKDGFVKFLPIGGWWGHLAMGQRVRIITKKGPVLGVVGSTPPHLLKQEERQKVRDISDMFIDVGTMDKFDIPKKLGVEVGNPIVPDSQFTIMNHDKMYMAKAFDNRVSCAIIVEVLKRLQRTKHPNTVFGVGAVQEEVGLRGATTAVHVVDPDVALVVDTGIAQDMPGNGEKSERLGAGPAILVYDGSMIPNTRLRELVMDTARKAKIPFHLTSMERGGTDAGRIHVSRAGVPSVVVGPPVRYIHSHNAILYRRDYDQTIKLLVELVKRLDRKTVGSLTKR